MKKTITWKALGNLLALCALMAVFLALATTADARESRTRSEEQSEQTATQPATAPSPTPIHIPSFYPGGSITSSTNADVETGGNTGGDVTTGDEKAEVFEVNVGPTNPAPPPPPPDDEPADVPENPCDPRTRTNCDAEPPSRGR